MFKTSTAKNEAFGPMLVIILACIVAFLFSIVLYFLLNEHFWGFVVVEATGLAVGIYAAYRAEEAANKSQETEAKLEDQGLLPTETRRDFKQIFADHLVAPLRDHSYGSSQRSVGASIHLLLSTPAYGYGVLGERDFQPFLRALKDLHQDCVVQIVLFSPDAHFVYWCNVVLWSSVNGGKDFAIGFAAGIQEFAQILKRERTSVWLGGETTVRLFGFRWSQNGFRAEKVYLLLVDVLAIGIDQTGDKFKTRSVRIPVTQTEDYVGEGDSYFERIKRCPYTLKTDSDRTVVRPSVDTNLWDQLTWDYILGRTRKRHLDVVALKKELVTLLDALSADEQLSARIEKIVANACSYFASAISRLATAPHYVTLSKGQRDRLDSALERLASVQNQLSASLVAALAELTSALATLRSTEATPAHAASVRAKPEEDVAQNGKASLEDILLMSLCELLTSGSGESCYAAQRIGEEPAGSTPQSVPQGGPDAVASTTG